MAVRAAGYVIGAGVVQARPGFTFPVAVPERVTVCVLPGTPLELSVMVSVALLEPVVWGAKAMLIVQDAPTARCPPAVEHESLPLSGKSVESELPMLKVSGEALPLVRINALDTLEVVASWSPKFQVDGDTVAPLGATKKG